jgi:Zn-dependent protease
VSAVRLSVPLFSFYGTPVRVHLTFGLLLLFLFWRTGTIIGVRTAALQTGLIALIFVCVVLHEFGHATVARRHGIPISEITLYPYGGVARLEHLPPRGWIELQVAVAGPIVNLGLAALIGILTAGRVLDPGSSLWLRAAAVLFWSNLLIAIFNLLPAFPLDGGRVLRGALATRIGWSRATVWAASIGQVAAILLIIVGIVHQPLLALAGVLLLPGANSELRLAIGLRSLATSRVGEVMLSSIQLVGPDASLRALAQGEREAPINEFFVHDGQRVVGFLPAARLWSAFRSDDPKLESAADAALPVAEPMSIETTLEDALVEMDRQGLDAAPVVDSDGTVLGVITRGLVKRALMISRAVEKRER